MNGVKYHRIRKGLSQDALAERAGITKHMVDRMEKVIDHYRVRIGIENYIQVRDALEVTIEELMSNDFPDLVEIEKT